MILSKKILATVVCGMMAAFAMARTSKAAEDVYIYGMATMLSDSVVYVTDIQHVEGAAIDGKTKFLLDRTAYSEQLRRYLESQGQSASTTCAVNFATKKDKLAKQRDRFLAKCNKKKTIYKIIPAAEFSFTAVLSVAEEEK